MTPSTGKGRKPPHVTGDRQHDYLEVLDIRRNVVVRRMDVTGKPRGELLALRERLRSPGVYIQFRYPDAALPCGDLEANDARTD